LQQELAAGLRVLNLDNARRHIQDEAFSAFSKHLVNLEVLHFKNAYYLNHLYNFLPNLTKLKTLVLTDFSGFERTDTNKAAQCFSLLQQLEYLDISYGLFVATIPKPILELPKLRHLIILTPQSVPPLNLSETKIPARIQLVTGKHADLWRPLEMILNKLKRERETSAKVKYYLSIKKHQETPAKGPGARASNASPSRPVSKK
jgi:hypothetical protein